MAGETKLYNPINWEKNWPPLVKKQGRDKKHSREEGGT
jgi:hypothetical protein